MSDDKSAGLAGITVGDTAISTVGKEGVGLTYRGYTIEDLAHHSTFEEVAYLLITGSLPETNKPNKPNKSKKLNESNESNDSMEFNQFTEMLIAGQSLPIEICQILERLPKHTDPMDVLRTASSALGCFEPEKENYKDKAIAIRLMPFCMSSLIYWNTFHQTGERLNTKTNQPTLSGHFLTLFLKQKPDEELRKAFDVSLILYAEHEFNASTFAARVCASTQSDFYSAIVSAIGTLKGPLHGGANEAAMDLIQQFKDPNSAETGLHKLLANKTLIMGFGHRVYKKSDPRSPIVKEWVKKLAKRFQDNTLFPIAERIEKIMWDEKQLFPNLDFYSALVYHYLGLPTRFFTPIFVFSRLSGWTAHIVEQRAHNRLIRPLANYIGEEKRAYVPINER